MCGATNDLHFDHDLAFSRGGTPLSADTVQRVEAQSQDVRCTEGPPIPVASAFRGAGA